MPTPPARHSHTPPTPPSPPKTKSETPSPPPPPLPVTFKTARSGAKSVSQVPPGVHPQPPTTGVRQTAEHRPYAGLQSTQTADTKGDSHRGDDPLHRSVARRIGRESGIGNRWPTSRLIGRCSRSSQRHVHRRCCCCCCRRLRLLYYVTVFTSTWFEVFGLRGIEDKNARIQRRRLTHTHIYICMHVYVQ